MYFAGIAALAPQHAEASERLPGRGRRGISGRTGRGGVRVVVALSDHGSGEDGGQTARVAGGRRGFGMVLVRDEVGVEVAGDEERMVHQPAMEVEIGGQLAADGEFVERAAHPRDRLMAVAAPRRELGDHRVVIDWNFGAGVDARVDADAGAVGKMHRVDAARRGNETGGRVLGIDAAFDGRAVLREIALRKRQRFARGDLDLRLDQIDAGHEFGDRMLDLDARVHLEEVEVAVRVGEKLDGAGAYVVDRARGLDGDLAHRAAHLGGDEGRGRLLDHLLIAALDRAFALEDMNDVPVMVAEDLHFDVARAAQIFLDVQAAVT